MAKDKNENGISSGINMAGGIAGAAVGSITSAIDTYKKNSELGNTASYENSIKDVNALGNSMYSDFDTLMASYNSYNPADTNIGWKNIRGAGVGEQIFNTASATASTAINGMMSTGSPYGLLMGVPSLIGGIGGSFAGNSKAKSMAQQLNALATEANNSYLRNFSNNAGNIKNEMFSTAGLNMAAFGGSISPFVKSRLLTQSFKMKPRKMRYGGYGNYYAYGGELSGDWSNGVELVNNGRTHEENPIGGVPVGIDNEGTPNLVEEGEVIFNDYVFSNRLKPSKEQLESVKLNSNHYGKTYADIAKVLSKESSVRPLDNISKNTLHDSMMKLTVIQEESREQKVREELEEQLKSMDPAELEALLSTDSQPSGVQIEDPTIQQGMEEPQQEEINPFTQSTPRAYTGIRKEMPEMTDEEQYAFGGKVNIAEGGKTLSKDDLAVLENFLKTIKGHNDSNGYLAWNLPFKYYNEKTGQYDKGYLDWLNKYKFEGDRGQALFNYLSDYYKKNFPNRSDLTLEKAIELGKDSKPGLFHAVLSKLYDRRNATNLGPKLEYPSVNLTYKDPGLAQPLDGRKVFTQPSDDTIKFPGLNALQFAPAIGSGIAAMRDLFQKPDYTNSDMIGTGRRGIRDISYVPIGGYRAYNPMDVNYQRNALMQQNMGLQRNILNNSANRGQAIASMLALNNNATSKLGELYRNALDYNNKERTDVLTFNRGIDQYNATAANNAMQHNSQLDVQRAGLYGTEAQMRDRIETELSQSKSTNASNFLNNIGNVGNTIYAKDRLNYLYDMGYFGNKPKESANGGRIRRKKKGLLK